MKSAFALAAAAFAATVAAQQQAACYLSITLLDVPDAAVSVHISDNQRAADLQHYGSTCGPETSWQGYFGPVYSVFGDFYSQENVYLNYHDASGMEYDANTYISYNDVVSTCQNGVQLMLTLTWPTPPI